MDLEALKIFLAVAAEHSVTRAAAVLGRAPSNVTTRIQQLELDMGAELFVRSNKRMGLTTAGERFLDYAKRLLALEEEARHVVGGGVHGGALRIGSMESTAASRLPEPLAAYNLRYPQTRLEIATGPSGWLIEQVRSGRLDCAFVALSPELQSDAALAELGLAARAIWREHLVLLLPASEKGATAPSELRIRALAAFRSGCTYRAVAEATLETRRNPGWQIHEMGSYHAMVACVAAGACVTILPRSVLALTRAPAELPTLEVAPIDTCLVWRADYQVPAFTQLLALLLAGG